jgi:hypothetical protein
LLPSWWRRKERKNDDIIMEGLGDERADRGGKVIGMEIGMGMFGKEE